MIGLALFLTAFIMAPTIKRINNDALQPYLNGTLSFDDAVTIGSGPLRTFMLAHTREDDLALMTRAADQANPATAAAVNLPPLNPPFMLPELRAAFHIRLLLLLPVPGSGSRSPLRQ